MTNKQKKRVRNLRSKTGMSHQEAHNALRKDVAPTPPSPGLFVEVANQYWLHLLEQLEGCQTDEEVGGVRAQLLHRIGEWQDSLKAAEPRVADALWSILERVDELLGQLEPVFNEAGEPFETILLRAVNDLRIQHQFQIRPIEVKDIRDLGDKEALQKNPFPQALPEPYRKTLQEAADRFEEVFNVDPMEGAFDGEAPTEMTLEEAGRATEKLASQLAARSADDKNYEALKRRLSAIQDIFQEMSRISQGETPKENRAETALDEAFKSLGIERPEEDCDALSDLLWYSDYWSGHEPTKEEAELVQKEFRTNGKGKGPTRFLKGGTFSFPTSRSSQPAGHGGMSNYPAAFEAVQGDRIVSKIGTGHERQIAELVSSQEALSASGSSWPLWGQRPKTRASTVYILRGWENVKEAAYPSKVVYVPYAQLESWKALYFSKFNLVRYGCCSKKALRDLVLQELEVKAAHASTGKSPVGEATVLFSKAVGPNIQFALARVELPKAALGKKSKVPAWMESKVDLPTDS